MAQLNLLHNIDEKVIREMIDDYEYTCHTIVTMTNIISYNLKGKCDQGKKMITSSANEIQPNTEITPDLVIEVFSPDKTQVYKAINEIKVNLPKEKNYWMNTAEQLKKYDDELVGWETQNSLKHDILFTTLEPRVFAFTNYMTDLALNGKVTFERNLSILHSTPLEQEKSFIFIKKDEGKISNQSLDDLLSNGIPVPRLKIINEISQMKFYDSEPPIVYMMMIIWDHVLKTLLDDKQKRELGNNKVIKLTLTVDQIHEKLSRFCHESSKSCLKMTWIKKALMGFVEIGIATPLSNGEMFEIDFKKHKGQTVNWIFRLISNDSAVEASHKTLDDFI